MCATCTGSTNASPLRSGDATASSLCTRVRRLLARQRDAKSPLPTRVVAGRLPPTRPSHTLRSLTVPGIPPSPPSLGFISDCRFLSEETLLTASGDMTCAAWDLERASVRDYFMGHTGAVTSISVSPEKGEVCGSDKLRQCHCPLLFLSSHSRLSCPLNKVFLSGSSDGTVKLWDCRMPQRAVATFADNASDVNDVSFFPSGSAFATAEENGVCKLYDLRRPEALQTLASDDIEYATLELHRVLLFCLTVQSSSPLSSSTSPSQLWRHVCRVQQKWQASLCGI